MQLALPAPAQMTHPAPTSKQIVAARRVDASIDRSGVRFCTLVLAGFALSTWFWANVLAA